MVKRILLRLGLSLLSIFITLLGFEIVLQVLAYQPANIPREHRLCGDCSYLYEPVPNVGRHNSVGLNGPEITIDKPKDVFRIVMVGDSVTYGAGVEEQEAFPRKLETLLNKNRKVEVINAGVRAYSSYTEVRLLRDKLMRLSPDLVVLQTCMNDITNPRWHWNVVSNLEFVPPAEAFPRPEERDLEQPDAKLFESPLHRSLVYTLGALVYLRVKGIGIEKGVGITVDDKFWPTYITAESNATLEPLTDYNSREWDWLRRQFAIAKEVTEKAKIPLVFLIAPLGYEIVPGYPLNPEASFMRYCEESELPCINLRPHFEKYAVTDLYLMQRDSRLPTVPDVWHFTKKGHQVTAGIIAKFLEEKNLIQ